jgi:signal transduction histidine kinase
MDEEAHHELAELMNSRRRAPSTLQVSAVLLVTLALLNAALLWGIFATRRGARSAAEHDLELRTTVLARSVEARLAALRADFIFLARSPPLAAVAGRPARGAPPPARRRRSDAEGTLLLFLEAHPEVRRLEVEDAGGRVLVVASWRRDVATIFPPATSPGTSTSWFQGRWPTDPRQPAGPGLHAWIDQQLLLSGVVPTRGPLSLEIAPATPFEPQHGDERLHATVPVIASSWEPPVNWVLTAREEEGRLLRSVEALTGLYGTTVAVNLAVMSLGLLLGLVAFRNLRRATRLETERQQQERVRELERQLMHSERLASVGRLAAGLAHEINNPLEGVSNYLGLLEEDLAAGCTEGSRQLVRLAGEGINRASGVIRQVLAYSDPGRGTTTRLDLREILQRSVDFVRGSPEHRQVEIGLSMPGEPLPVEGNPVTLGQVFLNLLLNACEAQAEEGEVAVTAEARGESARVQVADRGPGIEAANLERVFEPFFSTSGSTGLGLALSKGIIDSLGGRLEAANRAGGGAELTVTLPLIRSFEGGPS